MERISTQTFFIALSLLFVTTARAEKLNSCNWFYSDKIERVLQINELADKKYSQGSRNSIKNRRGQVVAFDFIPGSLNKEPVLIEGGLWYQINYFSKFNLLTNRQNFFIDVLKNSGKDIRNLVLEGHPIVVVSRVTQPESIIASYEQGNRNSFYKSVSLEDHAQDTWDIISHLRASKQIGAKKKIQIISLSFGVTKAMHFAAQFGDQISHKHIMAPLSKSGDNFPAESKIQADIIKATQSMYQLWKLNPLTAMWANSASQQSVDFIYKTSSSKYSAQLVDGAFKSNEELAQLEKTYPGIKESIRKGLENDMDAARPDRFQLDDPDFFKYFTKTTIYLAGDEEPARLKSQLSAYLRIREHLGKKAPNLVLMDDAEHAITATAPAQTSYFVSQLISEPRLFKSEGTVYYMHKGDMTSRVRPLNDLAFKLLIEEIQTQEGVKYPSIFEVIFHPQIYANRINFHITAMKDIMEAMNHGGQQMPADFQPVQNRPFEQARYMPQTPELQKYLQDNFEMQKQIIEKLTEVKDKAVNALKLGDVMGMPQ